MNPRSGPVQSVEAYVAFLEREAMSLERRLTVAAHWGGSEKGRPYGRRESKYGFVTPVLERGVCPKHGDGQISVVTDGRQVCLSCRREYANLRRAILGQVVPGRKRRSPRRECSHDGPCDRRFTPSRPYGYCRTRANLYQAEHRREHGRGPNE